MEKLVAGLMSGTSVDGIDAALVRVRKFGLETEAEMIHFVNLPFDDETRSEILSCMDLEKATIPQLSSLNFKLGYEFAEAVKKLCASAGIKLSDLDLIGSHGQTIYHQPKADGGQWKSTFQIGEASVIAYETDTVTVSNFRPMDMAAGGEGAPLVPYTEYLLYRSVNKGRALQNIGGIGNVTVLPTNGKLEDVYAFDTGPGNMVIDDLCRRLKGIPYDEQGKLAAKGKVHQEIVTQYMKRDYFDMLPPKSTGREMFGTAFVDELLAEYGHLPADDLIATSTYFTAFSIKDAYEKFIFPKTDISEIIIGGGGSYNQTLVRMLKELFPETDVFIQEELGFSSDAKEAVAFAILANETIHYQPANVPSATGAKGRVVLGSVTFPPSGIKAAIPLHENR